MRKLILVLTCLLAGSAFAQGMLSSANTNTFGGIFVSPGNLTLGPTSSIQFQGQNANCVVVSPAGNCLSYNSGTGFLTDVGSLLITGQLVLGNSSSTRSLEI